MLFNSVQFFIFFPVVVATYFALPKWCRWLWLLAASYFFYMSWHVEYIVLILFSTIVDYVVSLRMARLPEKKQRRKYLLLSLITNLGLLFTFKYYNFFSDSLSTLGHAANIPLSLPALNILLPVGISFYTFQTLSYTIDVYRGRLQPERHVGIFALFVAFWPQLVAGPIERAQHLLPQFRQSFAFDYERVRIGLLQMLWGFFKKLVIADRLAIYVNAVYNNPDQYDALPIAVATLFFAFQIYCDFSGYSDIAVGAAKVMGYDLMENFRTPYFSLSITEFWQRWHISLSTWFRDYLYIPLGGNRVPRWHWYLNLLITFLISGLWHGANWTFIVWGLLHGLYVVVENMLRPFASRIGEYHPNVEMVINHKLVRGPITFGLVTFAWIFFRANSISDATIIIRHLFVNLDGVGLFTAGDRLEVVWGFFVIGLLFFHEAWLGTSFWRKEGIMQYSWLRWGYYTTLIFFITWFGVFSNSEFIYFQF